MHIGINFVPVDNLTQLPFVYVEQEWLFKYAKFMKIKVYSIFISVMEQRASGFKKTLLQSLIGLYSCL